MKKQDRINDIIRTGSIGQDSSGNKYICIKDHVFNPMHMSLNKKYWKALKKK